MNLTYCEDILIKLNIPVNIDESSLYKYDPNSEFYNDNCFTYTTENGTDIILNDRKQEFTDNNLSLCENNCNYTGYDKDNKQSSCDCNIKNKMDLISEIIETPNKLSNDFASEESSSSSGASNIISIKCTKTLFSKDGLKKNISSYILIIFITYFLLAIMLFIKCGYPLLVNDINEILNEKEKIKKQNPIRNQLEVQGGVKKIRKIKKKKKGKKIGKRKINYPPKKYNLNFFNNMNSSKINNNNNKSTLDINLGNSNLNNQNSNIINEDEEVGNNVVDSPKKNVKNKINKQKINKTIKMVYNDYELNSFDYKEAILSDKRTFFEYYIALTKTKNIIFFSFCPQKDYNSIIIRSSIFCLSFSIYYAINFAFFTDEIMHKNMKMEENMILFISCQK